MAAIRVVLPYHLRNLARVEGEISLELDPARPATLGAAIDALEALHPVLRGTIRAHGGGPRRPFIRFYACREDHSMEGWDFPLPEEVAAGREPLLVVGAMAGG